MTEEKKEEIKVPEKFQKLVGEIEKMTVLDLAELVKILEEKFGVSAAAPVAAPAAAGEAAPAAEEKSSFNIEFSTGFPSSSKSVTVVCIIIVG